MRPNGVCASTCFRNSLAAKPAVCRPSVSTIPGLIAFTRMLRGQLLGEGPGDGVDRRLGGAVDRCVRRRDRAGARADVDDAADQALGLGLWTNRRISVLLSESDGPSPARLQAA